MPNSNANSIVSKPSTNRTIAVLIIAGAIVSAIKASAGVFLKQIADYLESRLEDSSSIYDTNVQNRSNRLLLPKKLENIFHCSSKKEQRRQSRPTEYCMAVPSGDAAKDKVRKTICTICRQEQKNPAAPSSCGHLFCWDCLIQWVSSIRPECPVCRSTCKTRDIILLHNYKPDITTSTI